MLKLNPNINFECLALSKHQEIDPLSINQIEEKSKNENNIWWDELLVCETKQGVSYMSGIGRLTNEKNKFNLWGTIRIKWKKSIL